MEGDGFPHKPFFVRYQLRRKGWWQEAGRQFPKETCITQKRRRKRMHVIKWGGLARLSMCSVAKTLSQPLPFRFLQKFPSIPMTGDLTGL